MYDLILRGGTVVDGKRSQPYAADICIREGRIARIAPEGGEEAREVVDVSGLAVAPGFIDIHTHSDACPLVDYEPESKLHQGITTEITGNCGTSILPSLPENSREIVQYFFDDTSTVSYTHLDVYKRQVLCNPWMGTVYPIGGRGERFQAVSYTHLDVYKRQTTDPWGSISPPRRTSSSTRGRRTGPSSTMTTS